MAKITISPETAKKLAEWRETMERLEQEVLEDTAKLAKLETLRQTIAGKETELEQVRKDYDAEIETFDDEYAKIILAAPKRIRDTVPPAKPQTAKKPSGAGAGIGKDTITFLQETLADGGMTEKELRKAGGTRKLRLETYVQKGILILADGKYTFGRVPTT